VMLNKGPYLAEGVGFLRDVLARMDRHRTKKFTRFLRSSNGRESALDGRPQRD
jgi:hypothetical protein